MRRIWRFAWAACLAARAAAEDGGVPPSRPLGEGIPAIGPASVDAARPVPDAARVTGPIVLGDALAAALLHNPTLAAEAWGVRAREARILQADVRPNPTGSAEIEDVGVSGPFDGVDEMQVTLRLGQLVELGGKRANRRRVAELSRDLAGWNYETARLDVLAATAKAFIGVLGAQEAVRAREENLGIVGRAIETAEQRLLAGIAPPVEVTRARVAYGDAELERTRAKLELDHARHDLSSLWGEPHASFDRAEGALDRDLELPDEEELAHRLAQSPEIARWATEAASRRATLELERSRAVPDVTVIGGVRRLFGPDGTTFVAEVAVPIPLWDRNAGAIAEAQHDAARVSALERAAELRAHGQFIDTFETLQGLLDQAHGLSTSVLPGTEAALSQLRDGYEQGRFSQLEVLTAERELIAARSRYVAVLTEFHQGVVTLERLLGQPLDARP